MLTYEQQTKKLLSKRQAVLDRIESDKAEIEKINAKLNAIQLAKIRDALGCDEQGLFELITQHPEQLAKLKQEALSNVIQRQLRTVMHWTVKLLSLTRNVTHMRIEKSNIMMIAVPAEVLSCAHKFNS